MHRFTLLLLLALLLGLGLWLGLPYFAPRQALSPESAEEIAYCQKVLSEAGIGTDTPSLLKWLNEHSLGDEELLHPEKMIRRLGSEKFDEREEASRKLVLLSARVRPLLAAALNDADPEVAARAKECIKEIDRDFSPQLSTEIARLLRQRHASDGMAALLRYLPTVLDDGQLEEIWYALDGLAVEEGKLHPALAASLHDPVPARREVAACIIGRLGDPRQRAEVRKLLTDAEPSVRLRAAQGLLAADEANAIPAVITLLTEPSVDISWQSEELLHWLAGEEAPDKYVGTASTSERSECHAAWLRWWQRGKKSVDFAKIRTQNGVPGLVLIEEHENDRSKPSTRLWLYGSNGTRRWELKGLPEATEFHVLQFLPGRRLLLAELARPSLSARLDELSAQNVRLTERDFAGRLFWDKRLTRPSVHLARRLPSGSMLFAESSNHLQVISSDGDVTHELTLPDLRDGFVDARVTPKSRLLALCQDDHDQLTLMQDTLSRRPVLDRNTSSELNSGQAVQDSWARGKTLQGRLLAWVGSPNSTVLVELDEDGHILRRDLLSFAIQDAFRTASGNTLVASVGRGFVRELAPSGRTIWEVFPASTDFYVRPCYSLLSFGFAEGKPDEADLDSVPNRIRALKSRTVARRAYSARELGGRKHARETALPRLAEALEDSNADVRQAVGEALSSYGEACLIEVSRLLDHPHPDVRAAAVGVMSNCSRDVKVLIKSLLGAFHDSDPRVRIAAIDALSMRRLAEQESVQPIAELLYDRDQSVAKAAAEGLWRLGPVASAATPRVIALTDSHDPEMQAAAFRTLGNIAPPPDLALPVLLSALRKGADRGLRSAAVEALGLLGPKAKAAVPDLIEILEERPKPTDLARHAAWTNTIVALGRIGAASRPAVPQLVSFLQDQASSPETRWTTVTVSVRSTACRDMAQIGR